ncbi:MAG: FAD:protein FMN transferase [Candidatus Nanoarchaeia archaeon]
MINKKYSLFGSEVEFYLDADAEMSKLIMDDAYELALKLQKIFNIYDDDSELSQLNRRRTIKASLELIEVLQMALEFCALSNGEYDISKGKQFLQRKNHETIRSMTCSYKDIIVKETTITLAHEDIWIDLGSIAKGYIAEKISSFFLEQGIETGYIDARGDLKIFGDAREIGIQHPRKDELVASIKVKNQGVATSGDYTQYHADPSFSHIINQKDIISATVVANNLAEADVCATLLMVCDAENRDSIMKKIGLPALIIDKNLNIKTYNDFERLSVNEK